MEQPGPKFVAAFVRSVAELALEADAQIAWLGETGLPLVDELALEFDEGFPAGADLHRAWLVERHGLGGAGRDRPTPQFDERRAQRWPVASRGLGQENGMGSGQGIGKDGIDSHGLTDALLSA
ncbi:hypothetical protein [Krasilnikovia sp. MM14-A1004]|uniref:hypothetical protein n=1 Tax=Krasilnikovia sp. MM14-A1004 TaxID=3373541 RepID=UPI00399C761A